MSRFSLFSQFSGLHGLLVGRLADTLCLSLSDSSLIITLAISHVSSFTVSHVCLIMIKLFRGWELVNLFRGWELVNNAARSPLYDAQHALLLLMSFMCSKLRLHQFSNSKH